MKEIYLPELTAKFFKFSFLKVRHFCNYKIIALFGTLLILFAAISAEAQLGTNSPSPTSLSTCQPASSTGFDIIFTFDKGSGCSKLSTTNVNFTVEYSSDNITFSTISNNIPSGVTYTNSSATLGPPGNPSAIKNTLTVTLSSTALPGTYYFRCKASQPTGCSAIIMSGVATFVISSKPTPTFTAQPGASACINTAVTYTTQPGQSGYTWVIPGTSGTNYTITGGSISSNTVTLKWLTSGSKTVTVNYTNPAGCTAATPTSSTPTLVGGPPTPTFTVQPSSPVCSNSDVTYTTQSGQTSYVWTYSGTSTVDYSITSGGSSTDNTVTLKWLTTTGNKNVTVNYSAGGCAAASATSSNLITVTARPVPTFIASPGANSCTGTDITYTTQAGQSSYVWGIPGTLGTDYTISSGSTTSNSVTLQWLTGGGKPVTINYTSGTCTGITAASSTTNINLRPIVTFTSSATANTCANADVTYTTQPGQTNYIWTVEGNAGVDYSITSGGIGTTSNTVTLKWLTTGASRTVTVNYTNTGTCTALTAATSTTFVNARPSPAFTTSPDVTTCANTDVTYSTSSGQSSYVWTITGTAGIDYIISSGGIGTGSNTVTLQWITAGSKTVTVNYNNASGCNALSPASSATTVDIPATPAVTGGTSFCTGGSLTLTSSTGSSYQWYKNGVIIGGATSNTYLASVSGPYTVKVIDAAGCDATSTGTNVTENLLPAINTSAQTQSLCFNAGPQTTTLSYSDVDNSPITYSITWSAAASGAGFAPVTDAVLAAAPSSINITVPAFAPVNNYTGTITVKNANGCISISKNFTVRVALPPDLADFNVSAADGCAGIGPVITISSATLSDGSYTVSYDLAGANTSSATASMIFTGGIGTFIASAATAAGSTDISITLIALVGCNNAPLPNTKTFTVNPLPSVAPIGGPSKVCLSNTITLTDATSGGSWSSADVSFATVNGSGIVTGVNTGNADIIYTTAPLNGCTNTATKNITINPLPIITPITGTTSLCLGTTTNLNNASAGGTWSSNNTSVATIDNTGLVTASASTSGTSLITYNFPADANGCTNSTTTLITVDPAATANAGSSVNVCQSPSPVAISLSGATVGGGATTGAWSIVSGGGVLSSTAQTSTPASVTYTPAANYSGAVTLLLTTNAPGSCPDVTSTKTITVSQIPTVNAGSTITVCQSAAPAAITLSGVTLSGGATTAAWSITSGTGTLSSTLQTASPETVTFTPTANFNGNVILTLTTNVSGACAAASTTRTISVTATPTVTPGGPNNVCQGSSAITLSGASFGGGATSAAWSITSPGGGTLSSTTQTATPSSVTYTPASTFSGTITLTLTTDAPGGCSSTNGTRTIFITTPSTAVAGGPNTVCQSASPSALTLNGASVGGGATTGAWSILSGGAGTLSNTLQTATPASITYTPAANSTTTVTLRLTTDIPGSCPAVFADRTINFTTSPTAYAGASPLNTCSTTGAVTVGTDATAGNQTTVLWSSSGTGFFTYNTSLNGAVYTPSSGDITTGSVLLTLTVNGNSPCTFTTSSKTLKINQPIGGSITWMRVPVCSGSGVQNVASGTLTGGDGTNYTYQWGSKGNCGVGGGSGPFVPIPGATSLTYIPPDNNCYTLTVSSGGCSMQVDPRERPSDPGVASSNIDFGSSTTSICNGSSGTILTAQSAVGYTYAWSPSTGLSSPSGATVTANPSSTTTYTVTGTATSGPSCTKTAQVVVTVNNPASITAQPASSSFCTGNNTSLNVIATGTSLSYQWWYSTTGIAGSYSMVPNSVPYSGVATSTLTFTNPPIGLSTNFYKVIATAPVCGSVNSNAVALKFGNLWMGTSSTDWSDVNNWSEGSLPSTGCTDVYIPFRTFQPTIGSLVPAINNLIVQTSAILTIDNASLKISGSITNSGTIIAGNGGIEFNGSNQSFNGAVLQNNALKNLTVSTTGTLNLTGSLNLFGTLAFTGTGKTFATNNNLTLKSTATQTANVDAISVDGSGNALNSITGNVSVERYFEAKRAWRYVSVPTNNSSQTIKAAWQEGATLSSQNFSAGYGTQVTDSVPPTGANGFDYLSPQGPSVKKFVPATSGFVGISSTYIPVKTTEGWMTFVRGNRTAIGFYAPASTTVLRTNGPLYTGKQAPITVTSGVYTGINNPYASALDMRNISKNGVSDIFALWDPNGGSPGSFGNFKYFTNDGTDYTPTPGGGSYPLSGYYHFIQNGQAFWVQGLSLPTPNGSVTLTESAKANASANLLVSRVASPKATESEIRTNLYALEPDTTAILIDGVLNQYDEKYSNAFDGFDARKIANLAENLAIKSDTILLAIERRHSINEQDTIQLNMLKMKAKAYRFEFMMKGFDPALTAFLEDSYDSTRTHLNINGTTAYDFYVRDTSSSWNPSRFRIVFKSASAGPLPVTFNSLKAYQLSNDISVEWKVDNEKNIREYVIEKSADGLHFNELATVTAKGNNSSIANYKYLDVNATSGMNYYRIKSIGINGEVQYTSIVKVYKGTGKSQILIYPNPLADGNINLQLINQPGGTYKLRLLNKLGQVLMIKQIAHQQGSSTERLPVKLIVHGTYDLEVTSPGNVKSNIKVLY